MSPALAVVFVLSLAASILYNTSRLDIKQSRAGGRRPPSEQANGFVHSLKSMVFGETKTSSEKINDMVRQVNTGFVDTVFSRFKDPSDGSERNFENMSELDSCTLLIIARNQKYCLEPNEDNLNRLTLLLLHCQVQPATILKTQPRLCRHDQTFSECTSDMTQAEWSSFRSVKARALSVCEEVSQQLFVVNVQRHAQSLLEMGQVQTSFLKIFKDSHSLLENISSGALSRFLGQSRQFFQQAREIQDHFRRNESIFVEASRLHTALLFRQQEAIRSLENDVDVLSNAFLEKIKLLHGNISAVSETVFAKHGEIMNRLDLVKLSTDNILTQLDSFGNCDGRWHLLDTILRWINTTVQHPMTEELAHQVVPSFLFVCFAAFFEISIFLRFVVFVLLGIGVVSEWRHVLVVSGLCLVPRVMAQTYNFFRTRFSSSNVDTISNHTGSSSTTLSGFSDGLLETAVTDVFSDEDSVNSVEENDIGQPSASKQSQITSWFARTAADFFSEDDVLPVQEENVESKCFPAKKTVRTESTQTVPSEVYKPNQTDATELVQPSQTAVAEVGQLSQPVRSEVNQRSQKEVSSEVNQPSLIVSNAEVEQPNQPVRSEVNQPSQKEVSSEVNQPSLIVLNAEIEQPSQPVRSEVSQRSQKEVSSEVNQPNHTVAEVRQSSKPVGTEVHKRIQKPDHTLSTEANQSSMTVSNAELGPPSQPGRIEVYKRKLRSQSVSTEAKRLISQTLSPEVWKPNQTVSTELFQPSQSVHGAEVENPSYLISTEVYKRSRQKAVSVEKRNETDLLRSEVHKPTIQPVLITEIDQSNHRASSETHKRSQPASVSEVVRPNQTVPTSEARGPTLRFSGELDPSATTSYNITKSHRCGYKSSKGTRCKRQVSYGPSDAFCYQHMQSTGKLRP